jgi:O-antigen/teichoic acid export membrane protein
MPVIVLLGALLNIILNVVLIPVMGIMGAAVSTICAYALLALIVLLWARKEIGYSINGFFLSKIIIVSILMYLILQMFPINTILDLILVIFTGLLIYSSGVFLIQAFSEEEKKFIITFLKSLKSKISLK